MPLGGAGAVKAGQAYIEIGARLDPLKRGLAQAGQTLRRFGRIAAAAGIAAVVAASAAAVTLTRQFANFGDEIAKGARRIGVAAETMAGLRHAARLSGTEMAAIETAFARLARNVYDASSGLSTAVDGFKDLGIAYETLAGLSPEEQFLKVVEGLHGITDVSRRAALAQVMFGRGGKTLIPIINAGTDALRKQIAEGTKLSGLTEEEYRQAEDLTDAWTRTKESLASIGRVIGATLAPLMQDFVVLIGKVAIGVRDWIRSHEGLAEVLQTKTKKALLTTADAFIAFAKIVNTAWAVLRESFDEWLTGTAEGFTYLQTAYAKAAGFIQRQASIIAVGWTEVADDVRDAIAKAMLKATLSTEDYLITCERMEQERKARRDQRLDDDEKRREKSFKEQLKQEKILQATREALQAELRTHNVEREAELKETLRLLEDLRIDLGTPWKRPPAEKVPERPGFGDDDVVPERALRTMFTRSAAMFSLGQPPAAFAKGPAEQILREDQKQTGLLTDIRQELRETKPVLTLG